MRYCTPNPNPKLQTHIAKLITDQEANELGVCPFGKKHFVRILIEQLQPGEKLFISRDDFKWRRQNPNYFIRPLMKTTSKKFTISQTRDKSGWVVIRME